MSKKYLLIPVILLIAWYVIHKRCASCQERWAAMKAQMGMGGSEQPQ